MQRVWDAAAVVIDRCSDVHIQDKCPARVAPLAHIRILGIRLSQ